MSNQRDVNVPQIVILKQWILDAPSIRPFHDRLAAKVLRQDSFALLVVETRDLRNLATASWLLPTGSTILNL